MLNYQRVNHGEVMAKPQTKWAKKMGGSHGQGRTPLHRAATLALLQEVGHHVQHEGCHSWYTTFGYTSYVDEHMDCGYVDNRLFL